MKILCRISVLLLASCILFKSEITSSSKKPIIFNKDKMVDDLLKQAKKTLTNKDYTLVSNSF